MTITTRRIEPVRRVDGHGRCAGFTLVEIIVGATLTGFILVGVLSAFLLLGRSGFAASAYSELEAETRRGLEVFGEDVRKASDIHWNSSQSVTLSVVTMTKNVSLVTYAYDPDPLSPTFGDFYRVVGDASSTAPRLVLVHHVASDFTFQRFKLVQPGVADNAATSDLETKQLGVTWHATRSGVTTSGASQSAVSAAYILRNKRVAN